MKREYKVTAKALLLAAVCTALLAGCDKPYGSGGSSVEPVDFHDVNVTMVTYNVGAFNKYKDELGHYSYPEVAEIIKWSYADIVGLNETDWGAPRSGGDRQAEKLASAIGPEWASHFFSAAYPWYGNAVIWNKSTLGTPLSFDRLDFKKTDGSEARSMGAVEFHDFVFCTVHLDDASETDRVAAIDKITEWATRYYSGRKPVFLAGDMNDTPGSRTHARLLKDWTQISAMDNTFPSDNPDTCIDYIFVHRNGCEHSVLGIFSRVIAQTDIPSVSTASDHCPVYTDILIRKWMYFE